MAPIRKKSTPRKDALGQKLDENFMRTKFKESLEDLRIKQRKVMSSNLLKEDPYNQNGEISPDALMMSSSSSIDLSKLSEDDRKVVEALNRGEGTYAELCAKYNVPCTCASGLVPRLGEQGLYGFTDGGDTLIPCADPNNPDKVVYKYHALAEWYRTPECRCKVDRNNGAPLKWVVVGPNTIYQPIIAKQIDQITQEVIRAARRKWFTQFFKNNRRINEKIEDHITRTCNKLYICCVCRQTSLFGCRKDMTLHISNVHHFKAQSPQFKNFMVNLYFFLFTIESKQSLLNHVDAVIEAYLDIQLFHKAEQLAKSFLKGGSPSNSTQASSSSTSDNSSTIAASSSSSNPSG